MSREEFRFEFTKLDEIDALTLILHVILTSAKMIMMERLETLTQS